MIHPLGTPEWWQELEKQGTPLCTPADAGYMTVTFFWREPGIDAAHIPPERVLVDINSVTDHHSEAPQSLRHLPGTDIWTWSVRLPETWCGTYSFIPLSRTESFQSWLPETTQYSSAERAQAQRSWWVSIQDRATADPLNPLRTYRSGWNGQCSPLILPLSPRQASWAATDTTPPCELNLPNTYPIPDSLLWNDQHKKMRRAWLLHSQATTPREHDAPLPLVILLDASTWIERFPLRQVLLRETRDGHLPPALYVFIEQDGGEGRFDDLACNAEFWRAVQENLLRQVSCLTSVSRNPAERIIIGQSLGGLSALYAALCVSWSATARFGAVLSQSGSFWWPDSSALHDDTKRPIPGGWLCQQARLATENTHITLFLEVGNREGTMIDVNNAMADAMRAAGHSVIQREFTGGHDSLCWRHGIIDGLRQLLPPPPRKTPSKSPYIEVNSHD